jgi:autotransporter-associated beta strand protein
VVCLLAGSLALVAPPGQAITFYNWTGASAVSNAWIQSGNWFGGVPVNDGSALTFFGDTSPAARHSPSVSVAWAIDGLYLQDDDAYSFTGSQLAIGLDGILASNPPGKLGAPHSILSPLRLDADQFWQNVSAGTLTLGGVLLNGHALTAVGDIAITGAITGTGSLTKAAAGTLTLSGANTYTGPTTLEAGTLKTGDDDVIPAGTFTLDAGLLDLTGHSEAIGPGAVSADGLVIGGGPGSQAQVLSPTSPMRISTLGTFVHCLGAIPSEIAGKLELATSNGTRTLDVADNPALDEELAVSADITNTLGVAGAAPAIVKTGPGTMRLSGSNTFVRDVNVQQGSLVVANDLALGAGGAGNETNVSGTGQLQLAAGTNVVGEFLGLSGTRSDGALRALAGTSRWGDRLTVTSSSTVYVEPGELSVQSVLFPLKGFTLSKRGPGLLTLETPLPNSTFANAYTVDVVEGELRLAAPAVLSGTLGPVIVRAGARLSGNGPVHGTLTLNAGGTVAPGAPIGALQAQNLDMPTGSTLEIELSVANPTGVLDQLQVHSNVTLAGTLHVISPVPLSLGQQFTVLTYFSRTGTFTHWDLPSLSPGLGWFADYQAHALVLSIQAAPVGVDPRTPSRTALLAPAPNPAAHGTSLRYELSHPGRVTLAVFDAQGRRLSTPLENIDQDAGPHALDWDRRDEAGSLVAAGNYIVRLWVDGRAVGAGRKLSLVH